MATQATLSHVIALMRQEGHLTRDTGVNSIKTVRIELSRQTSAMREMLKIMQAQEERFRLGRAGQDSNTGAPPVGPPPAPPPPPVPPPGLGLNDILAAFGALSRLGALGQIAAVAIGGALGVVIGQFKAIQLIFPKTVGSIITKITDFSTSLTARLRALANSITQSFIATAANFGNQLRAAFSNAAGRINQLGKVGKAFTGTISTIADAMGRITNNFIDVVKLIKNAIKTSSSLSSAFSSVMTPLNKFLGAIKAVAKVVGRIFVPITIALTIFDTIKGIIDGYVEGGILGALAGGIKGLFNSLIFVPLDLLKSAVAWIAGKLGFDETAEFLKSFSFTELFTKMVDGIFGFLEKAWEWIKPIFTDPAAVLAEGWRLLTGGVENLGSWILGKVEGVWNWITGIFSNLADMLPSMEELRTTILNLMPDWMRKMVGAPERTAGEIVNEKMQENKAELDAAKARVALSESGGNAYSMFTTEESGREKDKETIARLSATVDAPNPEIAMIDQTLNTLRSERATLFQTALDNESTSGAYVKPDTTALDASIAEYEALKAKSTSPDLLESKMPGAPYAMIASRREIPSNDVAINLAREMIAANKVRLDRVEQSEIGRSGSPTIVVNAPTVAPVNNNVTGPTNVSNQRVTSIGTGSGMSGLGRFAN